MNPRMDPRLSKIVADVQDAQMRMNPNGEGEIVDAGKLLQIELLQHYVASEFSEDDLFRALDALGVPEEDQISWFEDYASYL